MPNPDKKFLRVKQLRERYGNISEKTLDRWRKLGRIPKPDFYQGTVPYWNAARLDHADREAMRNYRSHPSTGRAE